MERLGESSIKIVFVFLAYYAIACYYTLIPDSPVKADDLGT